MSGSTASGLLQCMKPIAAAPRSFQSAATVAFCNGWNAASSSVLPSDTAAAHAMRHSGSESNAASVPATSFAPLLPRRTIARSRNGDAALLLAIVAKNANVSLRSPSIAANVSTSWTSARVSVSLSMRSRAIATAASPPISRNALSPAARTAPSGAATTAFSKSTACAGCSTGFLPVTRSGSVRARRTSWMPLVPAFFNASIARGERSPSP